MEEISKNKKGMLLASEVLKIVLSVIAIFFLIYLLFSIYYSNINEQRKQEAEATIGRIRDIISRINNGAVESERVTDIVPASWSFFSFVGNEKKPNLCAGENCLCICNTPFSIFGISFSEQISKCDGAGVCLAVSNLNKFQEFEIEKASDGGTNIEISGDSDKIEVKRI